MPAREGLQPFETTVEAPNASVARERAYATLGGRHGLSRNRIEIDEVAA